jgi:hypothetical protein
MAIVVNPGPLPDDGSRINVDSVLDNFINNTNVNNFGPDEFVGNEDINFVVAQTDEPTSNVPLLWFKRGEGVLYFRDAQSSGESIAEWVAMSNRKELVVRVQSGPAALGSVLWLDTGAGQGQFTEYYGVQVGVNRMMMKVQATEMDIPSQPLRQLPVPPYFVIQEEVPLTFSVTSFSGVGDGVYKKVVELGYCRARVNGDGPGAGILQSSDPAEAYDMFTVSTAPLGFSNSWGAHVVGSGPVDSDGTQLIYLRGTPANVGW